MTLSNVEAPVSGLLERLVAVLAGERPEFQVHSVNVAAEQVASARSEEFLATQLTRGGEDPAWRERSGKCGAVSKER